MSKRISNNEIYEKLVSSYIESRNNSGFHFLKMSLIVLEAKNKLSKRIWNKWLKDIRVKLKSTQAKKLVVIAQHCQNDSQLTDLLNKEGIEKTYVVCRIEDKTKREELAETIIDAQYTVKQVQLVAQKMENENKPAIQAIEEIKNQPKAVNPIKKTVPVEQFNKLKTDYELLLKEKQRLENLIKNQSAKTVLPNQENIEGQLLKEPEKSDLEEYTINEAERSIILKGYKLPIPDHVDLKKQDINFVEISTINYCNNKFKLDLS